MTKISVTLEQGQEIQVEPGTTLLEISKTHAAGGASLITGAIINNRLTNLDFQVNEKAKIKFLDVTTLLGHRTYVQSLCFVFIRAAREIIPGCRVMVEHSLAKGLYCEIKGESITLAKVKAIEARMKKIVAANEPFEKVILSKEEAMEIFQRDNRDDKVRMLTYLNKPMVHIYKCGWMYDFFYGYMVPTTGCLKLFALQFHLPGVIIQFPLPENPASIPQYVPQPKLAKIFYEAERWSEIMEIETVQDLNDLVERGETAQVIRVAEALHEKKIANIADAIYDHKERGNIILIAGPSSSGKTTFAQRLMVQLMVNGLKPFAISMDDYFVNREDTPRDEKGEHDFEALEAIDIELFNDHLTLLIQGLEIEMPTFNFKTGSREYRGHKVKIRPNQPIIIEGIHGLNEKLTYSIPQDHKFKIYISALTQLNIDNHNRIPTTDARKIRRLVRDHQFRGNDALTTLKIWPSVRRGEDKNIFPYQEEAGIMFNSALIYELAVLRPYAEPLLKAIGPEHEEHVEASRLLRFLSYFLPLAPEHIPSNSIIKEFIG
ncbi:MAG: nucleoside kinase [Clostridia bacterium]|nr:nucleoside kinase [Clostridia bacterium]